MIFRKARELGPQPRITYPEKLTIYFHGKVWAFNKKEDFQVFVKKRPELNRKFDAYHINQGKHEKVNKKENGKRDFFFFSICFFKGFNEFKLSVFLNREMFHLILKNCIHFYSN